MLAWSVLSLLLRSGFAKRTEVVGVHFCIKFNSGNTETVFGHSGLRFSFFLNFSLRFDELDPVGLFLLCSVQVICISQRERGVGKGCQARCSAHRLPAVL